MAEKKIIHEKVTNNSGGAIYGLGLIGALFYFIQQSTNWQEGIIGFIKAILWPAFLVYSLLGFLRIN